GGQDDGGSALGDGALRPGGVLTMGPQAALYPGGLASQALDPGRLRRPLFDGLKAIAVLAAIAALAGCGRPAPNAAPDAAVRELVDRLGGVHGDPVDAKAVFELLSKRTQASLAARAQRYSAASGKTIAPEAILAPERFVLRFEPQRYTAQIRGNNALVEVIGL